MPTNSNACTGSIRANRKRVNPAKVMAKQRPRKSEGADGRGRSAHCRFDGSQGKSLTQRRPAHSNNGIEPYQPLVVGAMQTALLETGASSYRKHAHIPWRSYSHQPNLADI